MSIPTRNMCQPSAKCPDILKMISTISIKDLETQLTDHPKELRILLGCYDDLQTGHCDLGQVLFLSEAVLNQAWEKVNIGKWMDVSIKWKQTYGIAAYIKVLSLLQESKPNAVEKCLETTDLGILLGHPIGDLNLTKTAETLSKFLLKTPTPLPKPLTIRPSKKQKIRNEIAAEVQPSLERFRNFFFAKRKPVKLMGCMLHWPALELWQDLDYIKTKAGERTVPIEMGKHYVDPSYRQELMKIKDFIDTCFMENAEIGYLAQHQLFDQVPELRSDIREPEYCAVTDLDSVECETELNAWFGPAHTVSPLHFDPKHNLLAQVLGRKLITFYPEEDSQFLYPHEGSLLFNTSQVDIESPDLDMFPRFTMASASQCLLCPGDMVYIPPKCWHHVRALDTSFSVSFWWQ